MDRFPPLRASRPVVDAAVLAAVALPTAMVADEAGLARVGDPPDGAP